MNKSLKFLPLLLLLHSCNTQPNSSIDIKDSTTNNNNTKINSVGLESKTSDLKKERIRKQRNESNIYEEEIGKWVFVRSFLDKDFDTFITPSFTIYRTNIESAGYAYFVRFSNVEQEYLLIKLNENTLVYGGNDYGVFTGAFTYDTATGHLLLKISDISNAEYKKQNN